MAQTRILVVDDEAATLRLCAVILNKLPDVEITLESDSCRAAERLVSEHFDLLITDIRMPGIDGIELLRIARQHDPHLSVLVITGFPTVNTAVESMKCGAADYIVKPFLPDDFRATVHRLLEERRPREAPGADVLIRDEMGTDEEGAAQQSTSENALEHQAFIEVETRYRTLFEGVPLGLYRTTPDGRILDANTALIQMLGYPDRETLLATNAINLYVDPRVRQQWHALLERDGMVNDFEVQEYRYDRTIIWTRSTTHAIRDADGRVLYYEGIVEDITERKQSEDDLRASREQLRALSMRLESIREEEKTRIARELHDEIGQSLTVLKINLHTAQRTGASSPILAESIEMIDRILQQVRELSFDLHPSLLDDLGLAAALRWYTRHLAQRAGFVVYCTADIGADRLLPELEVVCFRVAQEALTNVVRHAHPQHVHVVLRRSDGTLELSVVDDGAGFDVDAVQNHHSHGDNLGLLSMQERVQSFGGQIEIQSAPQRGTTVRAWFPLTPAGANRTR